MCSVAVYAGENTALWLDSDESSAITATWRLAFEKALGQAVLGQQQLQQQAAAALGLTPNPHAPQQTMPPPPMFQPPPPLEEIAPPIPPMQPAIAGLATSAEVITGYFPAPGSLGLSFHDAGSRVTVLNVKPDGAAGQQPALRPGLRLKTVQGQDVSSAAYSQVIDLIKAGGRPLTLKFDLPAAAMAPSAPAPAQALPSAQAPVSPVPAPAMALPPAPALAPGPALQLSPVRQEEDPKDVEHPLAVVATSSESEVDEYFCDGCDPDAEKASLAGIMFSKGDASKDDGTEDLCQACYDRVPQDRQVEYRQVDLASTAVVEEFFCDKCDPDGEKLALTSCMFSKIEGDEEDLCQACFSGLPSEQHAGYERVELPPGSDDEGGVAAPLVEIDDVPSTVLPPHWATHVDQASGRPYWHNALSGETSWSDPAAALALHVSKTLELSHLEPPAEPAATPPTTCVGDTKTPYVVAMAPLSTRAQSLLEGSSSGQNMPSLVAVSPAATTAATASGAVQNLPPTVAVSPV